MEPFKLIYVAKFDYLRACLGMRKCVKSTVIKIGKLIIFIEFSDLPKKMGDWLIVYD